MPQPDAAVARNSCENGHGLIWIIGRLFFALILLVLPACDGVQSTLAPAGKGAERIADLFASMAVGALILWLIVVGLAIYASAVRPGPHDRGAALLVIGGGAALPIVVLAVLLFYGLAMLPELLAPAPEGSLAISVSGEQWWWRVRYPAAGSSSPDEGAVELANEIRLPVGEPVDFLLESPDVIHSFWIPSLGGKVDMIPGRTTRLTLHPTSTGIFRGACAEYCGTSHALMNFYVVVMEREDFARWRERQASPAQPPSNRVAERGQQVFLESGCGACHSIRGTVADGAVGPDLTHVGSRLSLGAGILKNEPDDFLHWITRAEEIKPGVHMPMFGMLPAEDLRALAVYLNGLR